MFHYFIGSEPRVDSGGFRMSGGWTTAKRGTVPVPRRFDSKQLTVAPQLAAVKAAKCQHASMSSLYASSGGFDGGFILTICCQSGVVVIPLQERGRGDTGSSCCVAQLLRPTRQLRPAVRTRQNNPQTTGSTFANLSHLTTTDLNFR